MRFGAKPVLNPEVPNAPSQGISYPSEFSCKILKRPSDKLMANGGND
jgi:hypothetical protein